MPTREEIDEALTEAIQQPKSATDDAGRNVTNHSLKDLADLQDRSPPRKGFGIRFAKLIPPGAG